MPHFVEGESEGGAAPLLPGLGSGQEFLVFVPECVPTVGFDAGSQVEDALPACSGPSHAAAASPGFDQGLAGRFDGATADGQSSATEARSRYRSTSNSGFLSPGMCTPRCDMAHETRRMRISRYRLAVFGAMPRRRTLSLMNSEMSAVVNYSICVTSSGGTCFDSRFFLPRPCLSFSRAGHIRTANYQDASFPVRLKTGTLPFGALLASVQCSNDGAPGEHAFQTRSPNKPDWGRKTKGRLPQRTLRHRPLRPTRPHGAGLTGNQ